MPDRLSRECRQVAEILDLRVRTAVPGLAVAKVRDGEIVSVSPRGVASVLSEAPMTARTYGHARALRQWAPARRRPRMVSSSRSLPTEPHVEHPGGGAGFWNVMRVYPRRRAGVVVMGDATTFEHEQIARAAVGL